MVALPGKVASGFPFRKRDQTRTIALPGKVVSGFPFRKRDKQEASGVGGGREKGEGHMEFGITFKGFVDHDRARYLIQAAEYAGFTYCWFYDSHILWRDPYPAMAMGMEWTRSMRFGPLVTNPDVRDWSVAASL